jgi:hypothetical protein
MSVNFMKQLSLQCIPVAEICRSLTLASNTGVHCVHSGLTGTVRLDLEFFNERKLEKSCNLSLIRRQ